MNDSSPACPDRADAVIVGGGIVGVSAAYHLAQRGVSDVLLLERGLLGQGATGKCAGGFRTQFSTEVNVRQSIISREFYKKFQDEFGLDPGFQKTSYLFLAADQEQRRVLSDSAALLAGLGLETEVLGPDQVRRRWPFLRTDDLTGGSFSAADGVLSPHEVLQGLAGGARRLGARILEGVGVTGLETAGGRVRGVVASTGRTVRTSIAVNAAGAWAAGLAALAGLDLPVRPFRRQVFFSAPFDQVPARFPLIVDLGSGWYMRREGPGLLLAGPRDNDSSFSEAVDLGGREWTAAKSMHRAPVLKKAGLVRGWAGLYALSPDHHAIIGQFPELQGFFCASGFSGHGFMHAPAAGLLLAELIVDGRASSLDLRPLRPERFREGDLIQEPLAAFRGRSN